MKKEQKEAFRQVRQVGILTTIPFILLLGPLIGYFIGQWIDRKFGVSPYGTFILMMLGFLSAVRETVRMIRDASRS